jgi:hypothetical protein
MVDRTALTVIGSITTAIGLSLAALSGRLARTQSAYFRGLAQRKPWLYKLTTFGLGTNERFMRVWGLFVGGLIALVGALWIARIGGQ